MISIGKPYVYIKDNIAYLQASITISKETVDAYISASKVIKKVHWRTSENYPPIEWNKENCGLWFAVPSEYKDYLCTERADAFVVAMLWYAMITGSDIETVAPISEQMSFSIQNFLIPALCRSDNGYKRIKIIGPTSNVRLSNENAVGTGMSCGIDSIYTLQKYTEDGIPNRYRLTHLTYYNMGAIFHPNRSEKKEYTLKEFYETTDRMSLEKSKNARQVAELSHLPLIYVSSNLDKDYYRGAYGHTAVYRNCAMTLALQKLFSTYLCSSGGWPDYFDLTLTEGSEHYESLLCNCFSTESLTFLLSDYVTRAEKTEAIADNPIASKFLDVCFCFNNCGKCSKCIRTLVTLDILGKVDQFGTIFNIEEFKKHRDEAYFIILKTKDGDSKDDNAVFAKDLFRIATERGIIPTKSYELYQDFLKKSKKKHIRKILKGLIKRITK